MVAWILTAFVLLFPAFAGAAAPRQATVAVPLTDVWSRPLQTGEKPADDLRVTQILFGERVLVHESSGSWVRIEAADQPKSAPHDLWTGYPGWIDKSALKIKPWGTKTAPKRWTRAEMIRYAAQRYGTPYVWGGLSPTGLDCSGFLHLVYRMGGRKIPRDAHDQWLKAVPVKRAKLKPADLIFSAKAEMPKKITHVALYVGDSQVLEAPQSGMVVRKISFQEKYGKPLEKVESGDVVGDRVVYFGSFLQEAPSPARKAKR